MRELKILLLTDRLEVGGAETHLAELASGLVRAGMEVEIISEGGETARRLSQSGIRHREMRLRTHAPFRFFRLRRWLRRYITENGYEVVHAHARIPALLLRGRRIKGCARIVTVHARFSVTPLLSRLCYWGERTVAVSEDLRTYLVDRYRTPAERIRVIPNGVDCAKFAPHMRENGILRLLFASRLDADCALGAELLLRIAPALCRRYPTLEIGIAGGGSELGRLYEIADGINRRLGRTRIHMHGQVRDMPTLLGTQDIFIGVSRAAMEAAACGCAVILCGNEGYLGILSEDSAEMATLSNLCCRDAPTPRAARLERDIRALCDNIDLRRRESLFARELIRSEFDVSRMVTETLDVYRAALPRVPLRRVLIGGYFGCGNAGDDAILQGFLASMRHRSPNTEVMALTASPDRAERRFSIRCIERKNPIAIRHALRSCDLFLCGGGSLLQNATSRRSLCYYLSLLRMARRAGCKTALYSAGIGPLQGARDLSRVSRALSHCDYISLRDPDSLRALITLGIDRARLHEGADPALLLSPTPSSRASALLREVGISPHAPLLCLVLRYSSPLSATVLTAVSLICRRHGLTPLLLHFSEEDKGSEALLCRRIGARTVRIREVSDLQAMLRHARLTVSMRLHALILASSVASPAIGIVSDPHDKKIPTFARISGQSCISSPRLSVTELVREAERLLTATPQNARFLAVSADDLRKKAQKDLANIVEMLYNGEDTNRIGI